MTAIDGKVEYAGFPLPTISTKKLLEAKADYEKKRTYIYDHFDADDIYIFAENLLLMRQLVAQWTSLSHFSYPSTSWPKPETHKCSSEALP